jgi:two-component system, chemotaxis family, chemotaxis protein CheY
MAKILVVDDSDTVRGQLRKDLESVGHTVLEAENGMVGIAVLESNTDVQLILCDVNMPILDGIGMVERLYQNEALRKIPKFMLTTEASADMKQRAKAVGVRAWLVKPYSADKLLAAINTILNVKT